MVQGRVLPQTRAVVQEAATATGGESRIVSQFVGDQTWLVATREQYA